MYLGVFFQIFEKPIFGAKNGKKRQKMVFAAYVSHFRSDLDQTCHEGPELDSDQLPLVWFRLTEHSVSDD